MPGNWDPQVYRARAQQWRAEADKMPSGDTRDAYLSIAGGYAHLADLIERDRRDQNAENRWLDRASGSAEGAIRQLPGSDAPNGGGVLETSPRR
jgi:hypothetical protein